ncbi:MAG: MotA/TolQ/ExbB proton channel family protein [Phycisphaerales bacterium]|jgi:biopolymer transport protein ExbB|nr:MotA/TolQ/ExbB proton channel family protein [Phycisphaerales bacterium]MDP6311252.1 MotA/TolQ/ExbB proton channel family protein [Phycisphaerales bacterium]MDP7086217.1 MotA/TolQ/ExbB proton channel family protein [Phycisphaerales bacterium]MDP7189120.1 MotA/TolQ/ExbB proton channel family protein [Phycisphaerales bacterium]MDP7519414.1 MotA/TolQ/ExbB proton channel family protein [Phycisphaerales bacterium]
MLGHSTFTVLHVVMSSPAVDSNWSGEVSSLLTRGGYVMIPLLILSIITIMLIVERTLFWVGVNGKTTLQRLTRLNHALRTGDAAMVRGLVADDNTPYGRVACRLVEEGANDAVALEAVEAQRGRLDRFMVTMSTIITAAPLLGILGTVLGIIQSFELLGGRSTLTDPTSVAGGIAAALLTTAFGLVIALVTIFPYMSFRGQASRAMGRLEALVAAGQEGDRRTGRDVTECEGAAVCTV